MPRIQQIISQGPVGALQLPRQRKSGAEIAFEGISEFGRTVQRLDDELSDIADTRKANDAIVAAEKDLSDLEIELADTSDHETYLADWQEKAKGIRDNIDQNLSTLRAKKRNVVEPALNRIFSRAEIKAKERNRQLKADFEIADLNRSIPALASIVAKAEDPEQKAFFSGLMEGRIRGMVKYIGEAKAQELRKQFDGSLALEEVNQAFKKGDQETLDRFLSGDFDNRLSAAQQYTIMSRANTLYERNSRIFKEQKNAVLDANRDELVIRANRGELTETEAVAEFSAGNVDYTRFQQIKEAVKGYEKAQKREESDPVVFRNLWTRLHSGKRLTFDEINQKADSLSHADYKSLISGLEERVRRNQDEKDISKDPQYQIASRFIERSIPTTDAFGRIMSDEHVLRRAEVFRDLDRYARQPGIKTSELPTFAERLVENFYSIRGNEATFVRSRLRFPTAEALVQWYKSSRQGPEEKRLFDEQLKLFARLRIIEKVQRQPSAMGEQKPGGAKGAVQSKVR